MTDTSVPPPPPKRRSVQRKLKPFPLFDTPALLQLLTDHQIKHTWATLLQTTLLHHTPAFTHPPTPTTPPPPTLLASLLASLPPSSLSPPAALLPLLTEHVTVLSSSVVKHTTSGDGTTTKLLVRLADGELVESVIMRHKAKQLPYAHLEAAEGIEEACEEDEEHKEEQKVAAVKKRAGRITLCISSQIGCKQACTFCATGTLGLRGHLRAGEIVEQLIHANRLLAAESDTTSDGVPPRCSGIVWMGQGEPLDNFAAVLASIAAFTNPRLFHLAPSRLTVSTVGLAHRIQSLAIDAPHVQLAVSLHAPTQPLRLSLVPTAAAYPLDRLMEALVDYIDRTRKRILIEYVLLHSINDQPHHATQLIHLLSPIASHVLVNLIPWNVTAAVESMGYKAPAGSSVVEFQRVVQAGGLWCSVRQEMGQDVDGACGQLALLSRQADAITAAAAGTALGSGSGGGGGGAVRDIEDTWGAPSGDRAAKATSVRKRRTARTADQVSNTETTVVGNATAAEKPAQADGERMDAALFDWRRSFAVFLLPLLVIVALSLYYR